MQAPEIELSVTVMTSTFWPIVYSSSPCILPPLMVKCCGSFEQFYFSRHSGRRLTWQPSLGYVDLKVRFNKRNHDLNVATFAAVILLVFSDLKDDDFLTYQVKNVESMFELLTNVSLGSQNSDKH